MSQQVLTTLDFANSGRITNLPDGIAGQDAATVAQLKAAIEGLAQKDDVRVRTAGNVSLASPGATLDGMALVAGDRVLVAGQTASTENGIYIWNGAAVPMTRSPDASTAAELTSALVPVAEGTSAGTNWRQTAVNIALGTTAIAFVAFGTVSAPASEATAGVAQIADQFGVDNGYDNTRIVTPRGLANWAFRMRKQSANIGDGTATSFTVTHNFNSRDVHVQVFRNSGNYDLVIVDVNVISLNAVQVVFNTAPALGAYRVVVIGGGQ